VRTDVGTLSGQCRLLRVTATSQDGLCLERDGGLENRGQCRLLRVTATSQDGLCLERDGGLEIREQCRLLLVTATSQDGLCLERDGGLENRKLNSDWKDNSPGKANGNRPKEITGKMHLVNHIKVVLTASGTRDRVLLEKSTE